MAELVFCTTQLKNVTMEPLLEEHTNGNSSNVTDTREKHPINAVIYTLLSWFKAYYSLDYDRQETCRVQPTTTQVVNDNDDDDECEYDPRRALLAIAKANGRLKTESDSPKTN